ncbi:MAG TPA: hypothetical protein GXX75_01450 [Clostridiales bacterium]|nr:hypothetical protein [Clostridiales bacterium]
MIQVKKLLTFFLFIFILLPVGCQRKGGDLDQVSTVDGIVSVTGSVDDYSDIQNDLVYRDYGTGIRLSSNSKLTISQLDLGLEDETAIICAVNLENNEVIKLSDYEPYQDISFTPVSDGVYQLIAEISTGERRDLTPGAMVETTATEADNNGFILLQ